MSEALTQVESLSVLHSFVGQVVSGPAVESYAEYEDLVHGSGLPLALATVIESHPAVIRPHLGHRFEKFEKDVRLSLGDDADQLSAGVSHGLSRVELMWRYRQGLARRKMRAVVMFSVDSPNQDWAMVRGKGISDTFELDGKDYDEGAVDTLNGFLQVAGRAVQRLVAGLERQ